MPAAYLTPADAVTRCAKYGIDIDEPTAAYCELASDSLDNAGLAFIGDRHDLDTPQVREFPRSETLPGDTEGVVPSRILDWVALETSALQNDEEANVRAESVTGIYIQYARRGKRTHLSMLKRQLLRPYTPSGRAKIV